MPGYPRCWVAWTNLLKGGKRYRILNFFCFIFLFTIIYKKRNEPFNTISRKHKDEQGK